jgi:hypothetical protein
MLPWVLPFVHGPFVPSARYAILTGVSSLTALVEGGAGPIGLLIVLFAVWSGVTTALCWTMAWGVGRVLTPTTPTLRARITWVCLGTALVVAIVFQPYTTPFGRAAVGGLLDVLS